MKMQALDKAKLQMEEFFPLKTFVFSFAFLLVMLLCFVGVHLAFFGKDDASIQLTGKILAEIQIEDAQSEPVIEPPKPEPQPVESSVINPDALLESEETVQEQPQPTPEALPNPRDQSPPLEDSIAGLSEETPFGSLPIIRATDGLKPFEAYKTPFIAKTTTKGVISLVMVDFGLSDTLTKSMIETLPTNITLVASPYAPNLQPKVSLAREKAFEVWMNIPMQGDNIHMGQNTILAGLNAKENITRLSTHLGKATGYAGVVIDAMAKFPEGEADLHRLTDFISLRGLGISQLNPDDKIIASAASFSNAPFVQSKSWIDTTLTKQSILKALADIETISLEHGIAVAAFHPSPFTVSVIQEWQSSLVAKNIQLAPLTYSTKLNLPASSPTVKKDE
jgi:polysaccharide deacetylase 2 family uncharacterized protein YibQ